MVRTERRLAACTISIAVAFTTSPALACGLLPLHVAADRTMPPTFGYAGDVVTPHTRGLASAEELYRVGDATGADSQTVHLWVTKGATAGEVVLWSDAAGCAGGVTTFADGAVYLRNLHVATTGTPGGDGSAANPFDSVARVQGVARAGNRILIHEGTYPGSAYLSDLTGTAANPIWIGGVAGEARPVLGSTSVGEALHLTDPAYVVIEGIAVEGATGNGINIDDGGDYATPAHHVVIRDIEIRDIGTGGNQDCLKLSGLDDFWITGSRFDRCGGGGSGIDMVGCHDGWIGASTFRDMGSNAIQAKGATARVTIHGNLMVDAGARAMNLGGSTGLAYFRPPGANYEARDVRAIGNVVVRSDAPTAFVGCDGCLVANNTFWLPQRWVTRILQETTEPGFIECRDGRFVNNVVVFDSAQLRSFVNVGPNTLPATFTFSNNLWYSRDDPGFAGPTLPVVETGPIIQRDPLLADPAAEDFHLQALSPAIDAGVCIPEIARDRDGVCYGDPPTVGAHEVP